ncbi:MAG: hypothetical protein ACRCZJ_03745 [Erysipelotrichaceae bacterium]
MQHDLLHRLLSHEYPEGFTFSTRTFSPFYNELPLRDLIQKYSFLFQQFIKHYECITRESQECDTLWLYQLQFLDDTQMTLVLLHDEHNKIIRLYHPNFPFVQTPLLYHAFTRSVANLDAHPWMVLLLEALERPNNELSYYFTPHPTILRNNQTVRLANLQTMSAFGYQGAYQLVANRALIFEHLFLIEYTFACVNLSEVPQQMGCLLGYRNAEGLFSELQFLDDFHVSGFDPYNDAEENIGSSELHF